MDAVGCGAPVPTNGTLFDYDGIKNSTCAYCDSACKPTTISNEISFFDGFDGKIVGIVYGVLILFTLIYQIVRWRFMKPPQTTVDFVHKTLTE